MDYKEEYQKALERAKKGLPIDEVFPELKESEDERIRKELIEAIEKARVFDIDKEVADRWIAYLEKQKERGRNIIANLLEDGITGVQRELIEFLANNIDASWVDIIKSADAYAQRIRSMVEKQKEQKPSWAKIDNSIENVVFPFNAIVKDSGKIVTITDGQLNFDGKQWIRFSSNRDDGFKVYCPEDLLVDQQPAEWSGEDDALLKEIVSFFKDGTVKLQHDLDLYAGFLQDKFKSIRTQLHWKPSEEQMETLWSVTEKYLKSDDEKVREIIGKVLESLYNDLQKQM